MKYFTHLHTVEEVKAEYRRLAKQHHPDKGGDVATMQAVNAQYHERLAQLNGATTVGDDGREHTYYYNRAAEQEVMDKLSEILKIKGSFEVYLIGKWLWILGDTKPIKESLKAAGCKWHSERVCWYWRPATSKHYGRYEGADLGTLAWKYGCSEFKSAGETSLAA